MSTETVTVQYINSGIGKTGKPYHNIKTSDGRTFWSNNPIDESLKGAAAVVTYDVSKSGSFNLRSITPNGQQGNVEKKAFRPETAPHEADRISVVALCKSYIEAGLVAKDPDELAGLIRMVNTAWHNAVLGAYKVQSTPKPVRDDLDDEIPY